MVKEVGCVQKIGKYNRQWSVVTSKPLNTTLNYSNSRDNYNENVNVESKEPITAETYSRQINDENDAFCLFLAYFLHLVVENNHIFEPISPTQVEILLSGVFGRVYGMAWYHLK